MLVCGAVTERHGSWRLRKRVQVWRHIDVYISGTNSRCQQAWRKNGVVRKQKNKVRSGYGGVMVFRRVAGV